MTSATPPVQLHWTLIIGAGAGQVLAVCVRRVVSRRTSRSGQSVVPTISMAITGASAGAFGALVWLWAGPMSRPVACLYSCADGVRYLTNEQFRQIVVMADLAWILPIITLLSTGVAVWSWRRAIR